MDLCSHNLGKYGKFNMAFSFNVDSQLSRYTRISKLLIFQWNIQRDILFKNHIAFSTYSSRIRSFFKICFYTIISLQFYPLFGRYFSSISSHYSPKHRPSHNISMILNHPFVTSTFIHF